MGEYLCQVPLKEPHHFGWHYLEPALFPHLSDDHLGREIADVGPASWHTPTFVDPLLDQEDPATACDRAPYIYLGCCIARLHSKVLEQRVQWNLSLAVDDFGGKLGEALVANRVVFGFTEGQAGLA